MNLFHTHSDFENHVLIFSTPVGIEQQVFKSCLRSGEVMVDVGANIGTFALPGSEICEQVYCFEPDLDNFHTLQYNIAHYNARIQAFQMAAGDTDSITSLYLSPESNGDHCVFPISGRTSIAVTMTKLDTCLAHVPKIDFVKIDTQGWEPQVIRGMSRIIQNNELKIMLEFDPALLQQAGTDPVAWLKEMQQTFTLSDISERYGHLMKFTTEYEQDLLRYLHRSHRFTNLLCVKK